MIRTDPQSLGPLVRQLASRGLTIVATDEIPQALSRLVTGQQVKAEVLARLDGGRTLVRVAGEALSLNIPNPPGPGTLLDLTFLASRPRLAFALNTGEQQGEKLDLSTVGRWLTQTAAPQEEGVETTPLPRLGRLPEGLLSDPARLAERLRELVTRSGLFYESHLAEWATGQRQLADILTEPQGTLSRTGSDAGDTEPQLLTQAAPGDPRTLPLVKEQLTLLATGQFLWQGEVEQGENLTWRISPEGEKGDADPDRGWATSLELELPSIGPILVQIRLKGQDLKVDLHVADEERATLLTAGSESLQQLLENCGLRLAGLEVHHARSG